MTPALKESLKMGGRRGEGEGRSAQRQRRRREQEGGRAAMRACGGPLWTAVCVTDHRQNLNLAASSGVRHRRSLLQRAEAEQQSTAEKSEAVQPTIASLGRRVVGVDWASDSNILVALPTLHGKGGSRSRGGSSTPQAAEPRPRPQHPLPASIGVVHGSDSSGPQWRRERERERAGGQRGVRRLTSRERSEK